MWVSKHTINCQRLVQSSGCIVVIDLLQGRHPSTGYHIHLLQACWICRIKMQLILKNRLMHCRASALPERTLSSQMRNQPSQPVVRLPMSVQSPMQDASRTSGPYLEWASVRSARSNENPRHDLLWRWSLPQVPLWGWLEPPSRCSMMG